MAIQIQSFNQILGAMIRKIIAETPLNDVNAGSVLLTLLEAAASNDFENNAAILSVLELLNIDAVSNNDLDERAADFGLTRIPAVKASGAVSFFNTNITKQSTGLYVIKPAPISGQQVLYVNNTSDWASSGSLYIGRGTSNFEGPINYSSITVFPTYSQINLASSLQNNHLISESVVNSQGEPDRVISAGTIVKIPANNQNPEILYSTLIDAVIPSGETEVDGVQVIALVPGSQGNAPIHTITQFDTLPFTGASVSNTSSLTDGKDIETDTQLRNRIKSYSSTLARGTAAAILAAVIGVSDPDDNKQVASAVISQPVAVGQPSILYIDDGTGFQPSYKGQSVDMLLSNAVGTEEFLQLANYPVPRAQVVNVAIGPYAMQDGMFFSVSVDGAEETVFFTLNQFVNINAATIQEVVVAINDNSKTFNARLSNNSNNILLYPTSFSAETIQVIAEKPSDDPALYANSILQFPTNEYSYISLYQNSTRLREKAKSATLETVPYASWNITAPGDLIISVDGTPPQDRSFGLSDFPGSSSFVSLTIDQWVAAFNAKFAGLTSIATSNQTVQFTSNQIGSASSLGVTGGTYLAQLFGDNVLASVGQTSQFALNRQTGNLQIKTPILPGDNITAGVQDAKGFAISSSTGSGTYNLAVDSFGRPAEMVIVVDAKRCDQRALSVSIGATITISDQGSDVMRIMSSTATTFAALLPSDFIYLTARSSGWLSAGNCGLYKIIDKGDHTSAGVDTFVEVLNIGITPEAASVQDSQDIQAFVTDGYPQIWRGTYLSNPPSADISSVVTTLNNDLIGVKAQIYKASAIKITSTTENGGSIAIPVSVGNAGALFSSTVSAQFGNPSQIASRISNKNLIGSFRRTQPVGTNVWLDRYTYTDLKGNLSSDAVPNPPPFSGPYSEQIQSGAFDPTKISYADVVSFTAGNNKGQFRSIAAEIPTNQVGTQQGTARTEFDHITGDEVQMVKSLELSTDDTIVFVMDSDPSTNTVSINAARTGRVNSGSGGGTFIPTTTEFSANDYDNDPNIDFGNLVVWGTATNNTNFADYAMWMRARNWYASGGASSSLGKMIVRSGEYGPNGQNLRFSINYPTNPLQTATTTFVNEPSFTQFNYFFGSGPARAIAVVAGAHMAVKGPYPDTATNFPNGAVSTGNYFDYTFDTGNFSSVQVGDVLSISGTTGVSNANAGQFGVQAISSNTIRVFNPDGTNTSPGAPQQFQVTTVADIVGTPTDYQITTVADVAANLSGKYFIIYSPAGSTAVWYDVNNAGTPQPPAGTVNYIKVATIISNDSANTVASKTYATLASYPQFSVSAITNNVYVNNVQNGLLSNASAGTSGFAVATTPGTNDVSVDGKYFTIYDSNGSVAVWYAVNNGSTAEPFHGALRSIKVSGVTSGMSAANVAAATVAAITGDSMYLVSNLSNVITITTTFDGSTANATAGTSGFAVASTPGSFNAAELITNASSLFAFPLVGTAVSAITATINQSSLLIAAPVGNPALTITKSTAEDKYTYGGNSTALAYGHNPGDPVLSTYVSFWDGINWIKAFENPNPNFTLKTALTLNGVSTVYNMDTCPNSDVADLGELFKLIPTTVKNVYHHLTQKAISQLPIISTINISDDRKNVQIASKQLGSSGSIEIVGGNANSSIAYIQNESEVTSDTSGEQLLVKVPAFPDTFNVGDSVILQNDAGVQRFSRLATTDTVSVIVPSAGIAQYEYNSKVINVVSGTTFTIADVSATYGRSAGVVWRWTHGGGATFADVKAGDLLAAHGTFTGWSQGNLARLTGDADVAGFPIIFVNDASNFVDLVNPFGRTMGSTAVGLTGVIQINPTPVIKWNLAHSSKVSIAAMSGSGTVVSVTCVGPHFLNTGDSINLYDDDIVPDGIYGPVTVTSASQFTFAYVSSPFSEGSVSASMIKTTNTPTRYKLEKLQFNGMTRLVRYDGDSPRFTDCGVAVDDLLLISGTTFSSSNNGAYRVLGVDNDSILLINANSIDELNTITLFNNTSKLSTWTSNSNIVTGIAGTFKGVSVGDWVKKQEDPETYFTQVTGMNASPASATQITLGSNYLGTSDSATGIVYDELNSPGKGVYLQNTDDIIVLEGDSVQASDTLFVQDIVNPQWFSPANIGSFPITQYGTDPANYKPFLRVNNDVALAETNRMMSVNTGGFYIVEALANKFFTIREITHVNLDDLNSARRSIYMTPASRSYKFSGANATSLSHIGKLGYSTGVTTGIDGYLYYTGLLQKVQHIVDGFEPDATNYPGYRAVGGLIETLPPLINNITINLNVRTNEGVNLGDISDNIKSVIINYIEGLGVGTDVILSEIIALVMNIKGVGAVTFTLPAPSTERITIASNEKATITPNNISIASS